VYGPRQSPHGEAGVVSIFGKRIVNGEPLTIYGDGEQTRDYVFVGDVAAASLAATVNDPLEPSGIDSVAFNVGTGVETSVNELANTMLNSAGADAPLQHQPARPGELLRSAVDPKKLMSQWGWRPRVDLAEGLTRTYAWIVECS
jgi:UDP-glucose 4-epimerase